MNESQRKIFLGGYFVLTPFIYGNQICIAIIRMHVALYMHEPIDA